MEKNKLQFFEESLSEALIKIHREAMLRQKKAIIDKACEWLKFNTDWGDEWDNEGRNPHYGMIEEFRKAMEE